MKTVYKVINGKLSKTEDINFLVVANIISRKDTLLNAKMITEDSRFYLYFKKGIVRFCFENNKWNILGTNVLNADVGVDIRNDLSIYLGAKVEIV